MIKRKGKTEKSRNLLGAVILYLLILVFFGISATFCWVSYFRQYEIAAIIDKDTKVMATLTEVRSVDGPGISSGGWSLKYEFTDKDGTYYSGSYGLYVASRKDEAEAQIGKQIEIFIDGQGNSILISARPNYTRYLAIAIILTIIATGVVVFIIAREILLVKDRKLINKTRGK